MRSDDGCSPQALLCAICVSTFDEQSEGYEYNIFVETDNNFSDDDALKSCISVDDTFIPIGSDVISGSGCANGDDDFSKIDINCIRDSVLAKTDDSSSLESLSAIKHGSGAAVIPESNAKFCEVDDNISVLDDDDEDDEESISTMRASTTFPGL